MNFFFSENVFVLVYFPYNRLQRKLFNKDVSEQVFLHVSPHSSFRDGAVSSVCHAPLLFACAYKTRYLLSAFQDCLPRFHSWV